ncbi:MAG: sulfurtransferase TusA family protein [Candidatus Limnocylindrales bacterium]
MDSIPLEPAVGDPADGDRLRPPESITQRLDTRGLSCPMPIVKTAQAMASLAPGELLEVIAYSPKSVGEYHAWSRTTGNPLVESSAEDGVFRFVLRRK